VARTFNNAGKSISHTAQKGFKKTAGQHCSSATIDPHQRSPKGGVRSSGQGEGNYLKSCRKGIMRGFFIEAISS
jgi:hypothetical protein